MGDEVIKEPEHLENYMAFPRLEMGYKLGSIDSRMGALEGSVEQLGAKMDRLDDRLKVHDLKLLGLETGIQNLNDKIDGVETRLTEKFDDKIDAVETRLDGKIDGVETRLDDKIDGVETRLNDKIDGVETRLNGKFDDLKAEISGMKAADNKRDEIIAKIQLDVSRLKTSNNILLGFVVAIAVGVFSQIFNK